MSYDPKKCRVRINGELVKDEVGFSTSGDFISVTYTATDKSDFERYKNRYLQRIEIIYDEEVIEKFDLCRFLRNDYSSTVDKLEITAKFEIL